MRPPRKTIRAPKVLDELPSIEVTELDDIDLERCRLNACAFSGLNGDRIRFDGVRVVGGTFGETKLTGLRWLDVLCERCDLSMSQWPGATLTRVEFRDCRLTGVKWSEAELDEVRFVECALDYASFAKARFRQISFERCRLPEVDFSGADLSGTSFTGCNLPGVDFTHAKLQGADVSASTLSNVRAGAGDVRGLVVSREQAAALAQLFGLVLRED